MGTDNYGNCNGHGEGEVSGNSRATSAKKLWEIDGDYVPLEEEDFFMLEAFRLLILGDKQRLRSMEKQAQKGQLHPEIQRRFKLLASFQASKGQIDPEIQRILDRLASFKSRDHHPQFHPWVRGFFIMAGFAVVLLGITIRQQERIARLEYITNHPMMNFQIRPSANRQGQ